MKARNLSDRDLWSVIYQGFNNDVCSDCAEQTMHSRVMSRPQPLPYVGPDFPKDGYGLLFCGIETYSNKERKGCEDVRYDAFPTRQVKSLYFEEKPTENGYSLFWKWVRAISESLLGKDAFRRIAYTNLVKMPVETKKRRSFPSGLRTIRRLGAELHSEHRLDPS